MFGFFPQSSEVNGLGVAHNTLSGTTNRAKAEQTLF
jgi:hypothetical protein